MEVLPHSISSSSTKKTTLKANSLIRLFILALFLPLISSCVEIDNTFDKLPPGEWRAVLFLDQDVQNETEETSRSIHKIRDYELPFNFEIEYDGEEMKGYLLNADERIEIDSISFAQAKKGGKDTVKMYFPIYNSFITALFAERYMSGKWIDLNRGDYQIPFKAVHGKDYRFSQKKDSNPTDFGGLWAVEFAFDSESPYKAIGEFDQDGNHLSGTFITETGDYRYLEGNVVGDQMFLSVFDGSHAFLFRARMNDLGELSGIFRSGKHYMCNWKARRLSEGDRETYLEDPADLTYLREGYETLDFSFETPSGEIISPESPKYSGKPKLIQIFGTWCPNCKDETEFLVDYIAENDPDFEVIGLAFEKQKNDQAQEALKVYKEKMNIPYEIALAGSYKKDEAAAALPALNAVISYPTLIFMDKNNQVKHIHTGFYGPATSQYEAFQKQFDDMIKDISNE